MGFSFQGSLTLGSSRSISRPLFVVWCPQEESCTQHPPPQDAHSHDGLIWHFKSNRTPSCGLPANACMERYEDFYECALDQHMRFTLCGYYPYNMMVLYELFSHYLIGAFDEEMFTQFLKHALLDMREYQHIVGVANLMKFFYASLLGETQIQQHICIHPPCLKVITASSIIISFSVSTNENNGLFSRLSYVCLHGWCLSAVLHTPWAYMVRVWFRNSRSGFIRRRMELLLICLHGFVDGTAYMELEERKMNICYYYTNQPKNACVETHTCEPQRDPALMDISISS